MAQQFELRVSEAGFILAGAGFADGDVMIYDAATGLWQPGAGGGAAFYQTIEHGDGTPLTQEPVLRIHNGTLTDDPGVATDLVLHYQLVSDGGVAKPQRNELAFSTDFTVTDNAGGDKSLVALAITPTVGQIIEPTTAALSALNAAALGDGTSAQVEGFDYFMLNLTPPAGSAADGTNLLTVTGHVGALWARSYTQPATNQYFSNLYVNSLTGNDSSRDPQNPATPLKTLKEAFFRISRLGIVDQNITINLAVTTITENLDVDMSGVTSAGVTITVIGTMTVAATQNVLGFTAPDAVGNVLGQIVQAAGPLAHTMFQWNGGSTAWSTTDFLDSANDVTNFFTADGATRDNPGVGNAVNQMAFQSTINNVSVRLPAGFSLVIRECFITGAQVSDVQSVFDLVFDRCNIGRGRDGSGPAAYVNCNVAGVINDSGSPTESPDNFILQNCVMRADADLNGCQKVVIQASLTCVGAKFILRESVVRCESGGGLAEISTQGLNSTTAFINLTHSTFDLEAALVFGHNAGINETFFLQEGGWVSVRSDRIPNADGAAFGWRCSPGRTGGFADLPVACPNVPCGFVFSDVGSGTEGATFDFRGSTHLSANVGVTSFFPVNPKFGVYFVWAYIALTHIGTAGNIVVNAIWTDSSGNTQTVPIATYTNIAAAVAGIGGSLMVECDAASPISFSVTGIVTPGALAYNLNVGIEKKSSGH
jgi:hypothetical protein